MASVIAATGITAADAVVRRFSGAQLSIEVIDRHAKRMMAEAKVQGLGMAVVDDGKVGPMPAEVTGP